MTPIMAEQLDRAQRAARDGRHFRLVHRARLTLGAREDAHVAQFALEDAINTADFGDAGRLIVVRSLHVIGVRTRASPHALSRSLEAAWRRAAAHAVSADDARAREAAVVWFPSPFAARIEWLKRITRGVPVDDWYWRSAVPEATTVPSPEVVATVLLAARDDAPQALAGELQSWSAPAVARLIARLPELALSSPAIRPGRSVPAQPSDTPAKDALASAGGTTAKAKQGANRIAWLRALGVAADLDTPASGEARTQTSHATSEHVVEGDDRALRTARADAPNAAPAAETLRAPILRIAGPLRGHRRRIEGAQPQRPHRPKSQNDQPIDAPSAHARIVQNDRPFAWPWWADLKPTTHGGLLMLIHVLDALGFEQWLEDQPREMRAPFVSQLFMLLADIARVPPDDPQRAMFADVRLPGTQDCVWSGERWPALLGWPAPVSPMQERRAVRLWPAMVRRALRRAAGLTLAGLVRRDAEVAVTRTHVDVVFPFDAIDLQLRRRGLDADLGWVPWLARIVAFHYIDPMEAAHA